MNHCISAYGHESIMMPAHNWRLHHGRNGAARCDRRNPASSAGTGAITAWLFPTIKRRRVLHTGATSWPAHGGWPAFSEPNSSARGGIELRHIGKNSCLPNRPMRRCERMNHAGEVRAAPRLGWASGRPVDRQFIRPQPLPHSALYYAVERPPINS